MDNNTGQNFNFSNNVRQFELNEAKKKMGIQAQGQIKAMQQPNQLNDQNQQQFNTMF
jgi:hypothetical protein